MKDNFLQKMNHLYLAGVFTRGRGAQHISGNEIRVLRSADRVGLNSNGCFQQHIRNVSTFGRNVITGIGY